MKRFFSFLGTSDYRPTKYGYNGEVATETPFIQNAIYELVLSKIKGQVKTTIFMTDKSKKINWDEKLEKNYNGNANYKMIPIGNSEDEIWQIFQILFDEIKNEDEIYIDITHGFRSLPLLSIVLQNYAKALKNITIKGIFYGAWEAKDELTQVAPIFDLSSFAVIQDWANASNYFLKFGNSEEINRLAKSELTPIIISNNRQKEVAINLKKIADLMTKFTESISSPNGVYIKKAKEITNILNIIKNKKLDLLSAFIPIIKKIKIELEKYKQNEITNGLIAVDWCINNNMIQQGYTILQEFIISFIAIDKDKNHLEKNIRNDISSSINIVDKNIKKNEWKVNDSAFVEDLTNFSFIKDIKNCYNLLTDRRNRLNHANFRSDFDAKINYKSDLKMVSYELKKLIINYAN